MPRKPSPAAATGLPKSTEACPVAALARAVTALNDAYDRLDDQRMNLSPEAWLASQRKMDALDDQRSWIEEQASRLVTQSGLGAIFQIELIGHHVDLIQSWVPENSEGAWRCKELVESIDRMAFSLLAFIEAATGAKAEDAACDYYMARELDPRLLLAKALAA